MMPTVLDTLSLELGWDVKKFLEGAKETQERVRVQREDFERHSKIFEQMIGSLAGMVGRLAAAFLSVEAVIEGIKWTKGISAAGTEYGNLAESIGMTVDQLGKWDQAMQRVGGRQGEVGQAFQFQQQELQKRHGPTGQAPSFFLSGWWQRLGLGDPERYYNPATKTYDLDRLNRDLAAAMQRQHKSGAERTQILRDFGFTSPAAQRLFAGDLNEQLARQAGSQMTRAQEETFRRLHGMWSDLGFAAAAVGRDLAVNLEGPITRLGDAIKKVMKDADQSLKTLQGGTYIGPFSQTPTWDNPLGITRTKKPIPGEIAPGIIFRAPVQNPVIPRFFPAPAQPAPSADMPIPPMPGGGSPAATAPPPDTPLPPPPPGAEVTKGGAVMIGPHTGVRPRSSVPSVPSPESRLDPQILQLPQFAMAASGAAASGSVTNHTRSSVSIGAMSFNSRTTDTELGAAPADASRQLSVAQYAIHSNQSIL